MKKYTKQIAVLASLALFAPWVNAQEVTIGGDAIEEGGSPLTGDMIVEGDATVNGSLFVAPGTAPIDAVNATGAAGDPPIIEDNGDGTSTVFNKISTVEGQRIANTAGGVQMDANGNVTLTPEETTTNNLRYGIFSQFDVDNDDNSTGPTTFVAGVVDEDGELVSELNGVVVDNGDPDPLNWTIDLNDPNLDIEDIFVGDPEVETNNGNLQVGGDASVDGSFTVDGVDVLNNDAAIQADVDQNESDSDAADAVLQGNIDEEETARIADDGALQGNIDDEETARIAADAVLQGNIDEEETARIAADGVLQGNIDDEETARIAADAVLQGNIDDEETARIAADGVLQGNIDDEETARIAADAVLQGNIDDEVTARSELIRRDETDGTVHIGANSFILDDTAGNHVLTTDDGSLTIGGGAVTEVDIDADLDVDGDIFTSGDVFVGGRTQGLQSQIDNNRDDIDKNARGIAMVAALQHTTVLPDMTQALDVSAAHFEGETGMALNYARRINENVQINFGAASTSDFDESVIKVGLGVQW